jgi:hypothetical protein
LPFLADTGIVRAAFFADAEQDTAKELFIIHSVTIRSDTGVKYSGDYYTVQVYRASSEGYTKDKRLSSYFGYGGDVLADDYRNFLYVFPYKDQAAIFDKLNSKSYKSWNSGSPVELVINQKTLIYSSPVLADITHMYLVTGDKIRQEGVQGGWISIVYRSKKGKDIRGWIQCSNAGGC